MTTTPTRRELLIWSAGAGALAGAALVGVLTTPGQLADAGLASFILETIPAPARQLLNDLARPLLPYLLAPVAALLFLRGVVRRQWRRRVAAVGLPRRARRAARSSGWGRYPAPSASSRSVR